MLLSLEGFLSFLGRSWAPLPLWRSCWGLEMGGKPIGVRYLEAFSWARSIACGKAVKLVKCLFGIMESLRLRKARSPAPTSLAVPIKQPASPCPLTTSLSAASPPSLNASGGRESSTPLPVQHHSFENVGPQPRTWDGDVSSNSFCGQCLPGSSCGL